MVASVVVGRVDPCSVPQRRATPPYSLLFLLAALTVTAVGQGGAYRDDALLAGTLIALAAGWALLGSDGTIPTVLPGAGQATAKVVALRAAGRLRCWRWSTATTALIAMALWSLLSGMLAGHPGAAGPTLAVFCAFGITAELVRRASVAARHQFVGGLVALGAAVAASGWVGVALRFQPWAHVDGGLWRAATTITYANASAALLVVIALLALAQVAARHTRRWRLGVFAALVGLGSTLSRAGVISLIVGLAVLAALLGPRLVLRSCARPLAGSALAVAGLLPAMPSGAPARPFWAALALAAGAGLASSHSSGRLGTQRSAGHAVADGLQPWPRRLPVSPRGLGVVAVVTALGLIGVVGLGAVRVDLGAYRANRITIASPDRRHETDAALALIGKHPVAGVGTGAAEFIWRTSDRQLRVERYAHDEYLQLAAEQGLVGLALLLLLLAAVGRAARVARRASRADPLARALQAGAVAALAATAVHSGFDFLWHVPAVLMVAAAAIGLATSLSHQPMHDQPKERTT